MSSKVIFVPSSKTSFLIRSTSSLVHPFFFSSSGSSSSSSLPLDAASAAAALRTMASLRDGPPPLPAWAFGGLAGLTYGRLYFFAAGGAGAAPALSSSSSSSRAEPAVRSGPAGVPHVALPLSPGGGRPRARPAGGGGGWYPPPPPPPRRACSSCARSPATTPCIFVSEPSAVLALMCSWSARLFSSPMRASFSRTRFPVRSWYSLSCRLQSRELVAWLASARVARASARVARASASAARASAAAALALVCSAPITAPARSRRASRYPCDSKSASTDERMTSSLNGEAPCTPGRW